MLIRYSTVYRFYIEKGKEGGGSILIIKTASTATSVARYLGFIEDRVSADIKKLMHQTFESAISNLKYARESVKPLKNAKSILFEREARLTTPYQLKKMKIKWLLIRDSLFLNTF